MIIKHFTILCLLFSLATISSAQTPEPSDLHVKLSLAENKTVYRIGEPIKLVMEFTADREGYVIEVLPDTDGPASDTISVSPEMGVTQWLAELTDNRYYGRCAYASSKRVARHCYASRAIWSSKSSSAALCVPLRTAFFRLSLVGFG